MRSYVSNLIGVKIDEVIRECQEYFNIEDENNVDIDAEVNQTYELQYELTEVIVDILEKQMKE